MKTVRARAEGVEDAISFNGYWNVRAGRTWRAGGRRRAWIRPDPAVGGVAGEGCMVVAGLRYTSCAKKWLMHSPGARAPLSPPRSAPVANSAFVGHEVWLPGPLCGGIKTLFMGTKGVVECGEGIPPQLWPVHHQISTPIENVWVPGLLPTMSVARATYRQPQP